MKLHLLKSLFLLVALNPSTVSFSQNSLRGTYETVNIPVDAPYYPRTEFPVKLTKALIQLKLFHCLIYTVTNLDGSNPRVYKGKWKGSEKNIQFQFKQTDSLPTITMEVIKLKSGVYIKPINDYFQSCKKKES